VLVLGAGGTVGEAWLTGVVAGIEDASGADLRRVEQFVGTSAGAVVAARLSAGQRLERPSPQTGTRRRRRRPDPGGEREDADLLAQAARALTIGTAGALASLLLSGRAPAGALARRIVLAVVPEGTSSSRLTVRRIADRGARFDGRLRICCVDEGTGRRVVFGSPGAPASRVAEAVEASCAIPGVFPPVRISGRRYVDGGVWSLTNLDVAAVAQGTRVLCLAPIAGPLAALPSPLAALRAGFDLVTAVEAAALRGRGARVRVCRPDAAAARAMGLSPMDHSRREAAAVEGYRQGRAIAGDAGLTVI